MVVASPSPSVPRGRSNVLCLLPTVVTSIQQRLPNPYLFLGTVPEASALYPLSDLNTNGKYKHSVAVPSFGLIDHSADLTTADTGGLKEGVPLCHVFGRRI